MAKADTVYSLFGMKSPYDVAREEMLASQRLLQRQADPYAKLGTALGMGLGRMFGGVSPEMARAQQTEQAVKDVEAQIQEAQQQQAEKIKIAESMEPEIPATEKKEKSAAEQLLARSQEKSDKLRQIANLLESRGQSAQAAKFSDLADKELGKTLTIQKQLADIAAKGRGKWSGLTEYRLSSGQIVRGGLFNGQPAVYLGPNRAAPLPPDARDVKNIQEVSTASIQAAARVIENDPDVDKIPRGEKGLMATELSLRAKELQAGGASQNEALQQALQEIKPKYVEEPYRGPNSGMTFAEKLANPLENIKSAFSFLTGDDDNSSQDTVLTEADIAASPTLQNLGAKPGNKISTINGKPTLVTK